MDSCIVSENTQDHLKRFSRIFLPQVLSKFQIELSLDGETIKIHICAKLPSLNEGFTIGEFYKAHRDVMLAAIVETGNEIQRYQISCEALEFQPQNARNLIKALAEYGRVKSYSN